MSEKNVKNLGFQTRAVHTGNGVDGETGAIKSTSSATGSQITNGLTAKQEQLRGL